MRKRRLLLPWIAGGGTTPRRVFTAAFALYSVVSVGIYLLYGSGMDLAIFSQALMSVSDGRGPTVAIKGAHTSLLGDHWHPLVLALAPVFWLWRSPIVLLIVQGLCIAIAAAMITDQALKKGRNLGFIGWAFVLSPGVSAAITFDFHEVSLGAPILAKCCSAYLNGRWRGVVGWSFLLLAVKEDAGLMVIGLAVAMWIRGQRRKSAIMLAVGAAWMILAIRVFIPWANGGGAYTYAGGQSSDLAGMLSTLVKSLLWPGIASLTVVALVAVTGGACLMSPLVLVAILPWLSRAVTPNWRYWVLEYHYSLLPQVALFFAALDWGGLRHHRNVHKAIKAATLISLIYLVISCGIRVDGPSVSGAGQAIEHVPANVPVATMPNLAAHLVPNHVVTVLLPGVDPMSAGQPTSGAEYILLDMRVDWAHHLAGNSLDDWTCAWCNENYCLFRRVK